MKSVVVLDYGSGNLRSAQRALARAGAAVSVTAEPDAALSCDGLVVPGVGAFAACMAGLHAVSGEKIILERVRLGRPVLGICVGMQVLFGSGVEHGVTSSGVGVWPGVVQRLRSGALPLPHMGWNTVTAPDESVLFRGLGPDTRFYFVHSYAAQEPVPDALVSWSHHGDPFVAAVETTTVKATQFHPEKSGDAGAVLLKNWLETI
jgi:imidazole glycerol-phosphate synthase subunit HisH